MSAKLISLFSAGNSNTILKNAKIVRKRVSVKFIDDVNFEGGNPFGEADPNAELTDETWLMGRKTQESKLFVEFELTSPLDIDNFSVNSRNIISKFCYWQYRGEGCRYAGLPIEDSDGNPFEDIDGVAVVPKYNAPADSPVWFFNDQSALRPIALELRELMDKQL